MILPINFQLSVVVFSFLSGILVGVLFDLYRVIRGVNPSKIVRSIQDILFWILSGLTIFTFLLYFNYGFLNTYIYIIIGVGLMAYLILFSKRLFKIENAIAIFCYKVIRITGKNFRYIFKNIFTK